MIGSFGGEQGDRSPRANLPSLEAQHVPLLGQPACHSSLSCLRLHRHDAQSQTPGMLRAISKQLGYRENIV